MNFSQLSLSSYFTLNQIEFFHFSCAAMAVGIVVHTNVPPNVKDALMNVEHTAALQTALAAPQSVVHLDVLHNVKNVCQTQIVDRNDATRFVITVNQNVKLKLAQIVVIVMKTVCLNSKKRIFSK